MDTRIPLIIVGDGPRLTSGLARIARDLAVRIYAESDTLGIRVCQVGLDTGTGWHWQPWDFYGFQQTPQSFGREAVQAVVEEFTRDHQRPPIVLCITDPARVYDLIREPLDGAREYHNLPAQWWGYFPIDAHNLHQRIDGPAAQAVHQMARVLGYGRYGAGVLKRTLDQTGTEHTVSYLPHGLDLQAFQPVGAEHQDPTFQAWAQTAPTDARRIGCVATNQPRKDLGLLFESVSLLKQQRPVRLWLHTDLLTKVWDVGQLAYDCGFTRDEVLVSTGELLDTQLAARYTWSDTTFACGLGEGFGYPIVESLACGTPVVHVAYAGGAELIPVQDWLVGPSAWRLESCYALRRPVLDPLRVAQVLATAADQKRADPAVVPSYCRGSVQHLDWKHLWPRWRSWIRSGLPTPTVPLAGVEMSQ